MTSGETRVSARPDLHELWEATGVPVSVGEDPAAPLFAFNAAWCAVQPEPRCALVRDRHVRAVCCYEYGRSLLDRIVEEPRAGAASEFRAPRASAPFARV